MKKAKEKLLNYAMVLFVSFGCFYAGCSSPQSKFYSAIDAQDIEGISRHYEKIDISEQDNSLKRGLSKACKMGAPR